MLAAFLWRAVQDVDVREEGLAFREGVAVRIRQLLLSECSDEFSHPDPGLAIDLAVQAAFAFMQQHILLGETKSGDRVLSDEALGQELTRMVCAYVGVSSLPDDATADRSIKESVRVGK